MKKILSIAMCICLLFVGKVQLTKASNDQLPKLHISEIYVHDTNNLEWIEITNTSDQVYFLDTLFLLKNENRLPITHNNLDQIDANNVIVITNNTELFRTQFPQINNELIFESAWSNLNSNGEMIGLEYEDSTIEQFIYPKTTDIAQTESLHRISNDTFTNRISSPTNINQSAKEEPDVSKLQVLIKKIDLDLGVISLEANNPYSADQIVTIASKNNIFTLNLKPGTSSYHLYINIDLQDQVTITSANEQIIEYLCWGNNNNLLPNSIWTGSCVQVENTKSKLIREQFFSTKSKADWKVIQPEVTNQSPQAIITISKGDLLAKEKTTVTLSGHLSKDPDKDPLSYEWYLNELPLSTSSTPDPITITSIGQHIITLTVYDGELKNSTSMPIVITPKEEQVYCSNTTNTSIQNPTSTSTTENTNTNTNTTDSQQTEFIPSQFTNLKLSRIYPNPDTSNNEQEWIEITNTGSTTIILKDWKLDDDINTGSKPYEIPTISVDPNQTIRFLKEETGIALNNTNDSANLINPLGITHDTIVYQTSTKGEIIEATSTQTAANDTKVTTTKLIATSQNTSPNKSNQPQNGDLSQTIRISELLPNPQGEDANNEWLEINNFGLQSVNLSNWQLQINNKTYTLTSQETIPPQSHKLIDLQTIKASLPNQETTIILSDFNAKQIQKVVYNKPKENMSYNLIKKQEHVLTASTEPIPAEYEWLWLNETTAGQPNPQLKKITGTIINNNPVQNQFTVQTKLQNQHIISYQPKQLLPEQKEIITDNNTIQLIALTQYGQNRLHQIDMLAKNQSPENKTNLLLYICIFSLSVIGVIILIVKKHRYKLSLAV